LLRRTSVGICYTNRICYTKFSLPGYKKELLLAERRCCCWHGYCTHSRLLKAELMAEFSVERIVRKGVPGFGGAYEVGDDGSVWRNGCRLEIVAGYVTLSWKGERKRVKVSYLVARAFVPNWEGRPWIRHKNGNPRDDRAENLEWSERKEELRGRKSVRSEVVVWKKKGGELVGSWPDVKDACRELRLRLDAAQKVLRGDLQSTGGYVLKWR